MKRLGIAMRADVWNWALVDRGAVVRTGEIAPGDVAALRAAIDDGRVAIGIALPDRRAVIRRLRVGHPPATREAVRRLLRWRLREDLPAGAALDGRVEGEYALALALEGETVRSAEAALSPIGPVERVTTLSMATLDARRAGLGPEARLRIVDGGGYADVCIVSGRIESFVLRDGPPPEESGWLLAGPGREANGEHLVAIAAASAAEDALNLATRPPVPRAAVRMARAAVAVGFCAALAGCGVLWTADAARSAAGSRLEALPAPAAAVATPDPEASIVDALASARGPGFTARLAELERTLPPSVRVERFEWKAGDLTLRIVVSDAAALEGAERSLASGWTPEAQSFRADGIVADFRLKGGG